MMEIGKALLVVQATWAVEYTVHGVVADYSCLSHFWILITFIQMVVTSVCGIKHNYILIKTHTHTHTPTHTHTHTKKQRNKHGHPFLFM